MNAIDNLKENLTKESSRFFGVTDHGLINSICSAWMDDQNNSRHRFNEINQFLPNAKKILDMASGCGTFVFYGLLNGYDVYGIEPEKWKNRFNHLKILEKKYNKSWKSKFIESIGERLPLKDNSFDCVSSYQTLEHVKNVEQCLYEMIRITRNGGGLHIHCPDYRSTFEGHYRLPWLPLFYRPLAKVYLKIIGRPNDGLNTLHYVTKPIIIRILRNFEKQNNLRLKIMDIRFCIFENYLKKMKFPLWLKYLYFIYWIMSYLKNLFTREFGVALFVYINKVNN